jgi:protein-L-isoaspartate(D-aspartate) O-methyltransferase
VTFAPPTDVLHLQRARQFYAEEVRAVANIKSDAVIKAFANVPRENFLGPGPWKIRNPWYQIEKSETSTYYRDTPDSNPKHLYHNVLVGIDPKRHLNNGEPAFLGFLIDALELKSGAHVLHLGCGTGYYSAILAEVAGPKGRVTAIEIDPELAARARSNLANVGHVTVIHGDGSEIDPETNDAILINAGATHPRSVWLDSLRPKGNLLLPLTVSSGPKRPQSGQILKIVKQPTGFSARFICQTGIYPCSGARNKEMNQKLKQAFEARDSKSVQSLRREQHEPDDTCWLHAESFCLSRLSVNQLR